MAILSPFQKRIIAHGEGHAKVLAAAGSGKTTTMVSRVNKLVANGAQPQRVLSLMFNKDARDSYRDKLLTSHAKSTCPPVFTFHGFGSALLKELVRGENTPQCRLETNEYLHYKFTLSVLTPLLATTKAKRRVTLEFMLYVDLIKNSLGTPNQVFAAYNFAPRCQFFIDAYHTYETQRLEKGIWFFSDLIYTPINLIRQDEHLKRQFGGRYEQIIVDEFQDISEIQMAMVQILAGDRASVMAVGDDDQCIYAWRGAKPHYLISTFEEIFPNPSQFELPTTFRYGHQVALAAAYLIKNNGDRSDKLGFSAPFVMPTSLSLDLEEVGQSSVVRQVSQWKEQGRQFNEIAVLVRSYSHCVTTELAFLHAGIPYFIEGGKAFFETAELGALTVALHVAAGTYAFLSESTKLMMLSMYLKIPQTGLPFDQFEALMQEAGGDSSGPAEAIDVAVDRVEEQWIKERLAHKASTWRNLAALGTLDVEEAFYYAVTELKIKEYITVSSSSEDESEERWAKFEALLAYAKFTGYTLNQFMLFLEQLRSGYAHQKKSDDVVLITSIHRSKGLEWPFVILPNLIQGRFPHIPRNGQNLSPIEEERRLFYVAMTRGQEKVVFIAPSDPMLSTAMSQGSDQPPQKIPNDGTRASQFLYEMNVFVSQRANLLVSGGVTLPTGVESTKTVEQYLAAVQGSA